jgi:nitrile hydratase accessory protein
LIYGKATLFKPEDPLAPPQPHFSEGWHAQALALADAMVRGGHFTATDWAAALGALLASADASGAPDNEDTYYLAVLDAVEALTVRHTPIAEADLTVRKDAWTKAYHDTPHGKPVVLYGAPKGIS